MKEQEISKMAVEQYKVIFNVLRGISRHGITKYNEQFIIQQLDQTITFFSHMVFVERFQEIQRVTINKRVIARNGRIHQIAHLKYPPPEVVKKHGRCNKPGQSILYGAFDLITVFSEMKPEKGDLVTITKWKLKDDYELTFCPIFYIQPPGNRVINPRSLDKYNTFLKMLDQFPPNLQEVIRLLVEFVAEEFSKPVSPNNQYDYLLSAYFSDKIFNIFEDGNIEAIYYPSVQQKLSFENIAIKPTVFDDHYELSKAEEGIIINDPMRQGGYYQHATGEGKNDPFNAGTVKWIDAHEIKHDPVTKRMINEYGVELF